MITLEPGDIPFHGNARRLRHVQRPTAVPQPGDKRHRSASGIGELTNPVVAGHGAHARVSAFRAVRATLPMSVREGHVALITGAGTGIGKATACLLAERGMHIALVGRRRELLEATARAIEAAGARARTSRRPRRRRAPGSACPADRPAAGPSRRSRQQRGDDRSRGTRDVLAGADRPAPRCQHACSTPAHSGGRAAAHRLSRRRHRERLVIGRQHCRAGQRKQRDDEGGAGVPHTCLRIRARRPSDPGQLHRSGAGGRRRSTRSGRTTSRPPTQTSRAVSRSGGWRCPRRRLPSRYGRSSGPGLTHGPPATSSTSTGDRCSVAAGHRRLGDTVSIGVRRRLPRRRRRRSPSPSLARAATQPTASRRLPGQRPGGQPRSVAQPRVRARAGTGLGTPPKSSGDGQRRRLPPRIPGERALLLAPGVDGSPAREGKHRDLPPVQAGGDDPFILTPYDLAPGLEPASGRSIRREPSSPRGSRSAPRPAFVYAGHAEESGVTAPRRSTRSSRSIPYPSTCRSTSPTIENAKTLLLVGRPRRGGGADGAREILKAGRSPGFTQGAPPDADDDHLFAIHDTPSFIGDPIVRQTFWVPLDRLVDGARQKSGRLTRPGSVGRPASRRRPAHGRTRCTRVAPRGCRPH